MSDHPSSELTGVFGQPFAEQVAFFRQKLGNLVPTRVWTDMIGQEHDRGFMVAGAMKADLLADLAAAVDKAIAEGRGIEEFRKDFRAIVAKHGWTGWTGEGSTGGEAWRVKTILRTNAYTSYSAGRYAQLTAGNFAFWIYRHGGSREPRPTHLSFDGIALPPGHAFWIKFYPPSDWGCSCYVIGARSAAGVRRLGGDPAKALPPGWDRTNPKTGEPFGIGKGWGYAPGASVSGTVTALAKKIESWPASIGAAFGASLPNSARTQLADEFSQFVDDALSGPPRGRTLTVGTLQPVWIEKAAAQGVSPATAEIVVRDRDVLHTFRDKKVGVLDRAWYQRLPEHITSPSAVLLDVTYPENPVFLLIFPGPEDQHRKLVVSINYTIKKVEGVRNVVSSGRIVSTDDIRSQVAKGTAVLIKGKL